ncbi:metallo-beta-lactamase family protein [Roseobacter sp. SK209-2-6]|uniref:MBL fold metallo-hydrolase n=1 Tax=Roseobacter sp. SK209-2-6 TaxID=388739 RepID=UPI0000F3F63A|nr:MBL fold metallo-hydrolase [Roseobacter sp. SK209-2-6]EBA17614.1 metallo-beta-lactamase family protein [Roseobacter sp. SK209-2-6]
MQVQDDFNPLPGVVEELEPGLRRILAPNPSPMTYRGTNTYLVGTQKLAIIDPGPEDPRHMQAILDAVAPGQEVSHIIVTHSHLDHSPLARPLSQQCNAPVYAFGPSDAGRSRVMQELIEQGMQGGGEGIDTSFAPDILLKDGEILEQHDWQLEVIHTPGHLGNHIALALGDACFTADHIMGWASSLVSPPDGDLTDFMASCEKLKTRNWRVFYPGHGAPVDQPAARLDWLIAHRKGREAEILAELEKGPATTAQLARDIYTETPEALLPAAERNVFAHLLDLSNRALVKAQPPLSQQSSFALHKAL